MEEMLDVTKQKDMSGFYRHLFRQIMGEEKGQETKPEEKDEMEETIEDEDVKIAQKTKPSQRSYRQRRDSEPIEEDSNNDSNSKASASSAEDSDNEITHEKNKQQNEEERMEKDRIRRDELRKQKEKRDRRKRRIAEGRDTSSEEDSESENLVKSQDDTSATKDIKIDSNKENNLPTQPKKDIWKKVTIGSLYDAALERYLIRKSERGSRFP